MSDEDTGGSEEDGLHELNDAVRAGLRRAGLHWMRAGYEILAGVGAFLDEIAAAGKAGTEPDDESGPTKIQLD